MDGLRRWASAVLAGTAVLGFGAAVGTACSSGGDAAPATTTTAPVARLVAEPALLEHLGDAREWSAMDAADAALRFPLVTNDPSTSIYTGYAAARTAVDGTPIEALVLRYGDAERADGEQLLLNHLAKSFSSRQFQGRRVFEARVAIGVEEAEYRLFYDSPVVVVVQGPDGPAVDATIGELLPAS